MCLQICDSKGFPFYTRIFGGYTEVDGALLSGLVSVIGNLGKQIFNQDIATIKFGAAEEATTMVVVAKDLYSEKKIIYFVFYLKGEYKNQLIKEVSTALFIENKIQLCSTDFEADPIKDRVDNLISVKFNDFKNSF
ncbi:MAG: hypothetical protein ACTSVZ_06350 [Promethearchaeota archaeon]